MNLPETIHYWRRGVRLYIGLAIALVTVEVWWWAIAAYGETSLRQTRVEEVYAWLATGLLISAVSIGPVYKVFSGLPGKRLMGDARRLLGVGAAWFATLHVSIAYSSLFKAANPLHLPKNYQQAFVVGSLALLILWAMAFTSFDKAFMSMGKWWFRLHRFVYVALLAVLFHAFAIGVHATQLPVFIGLSIVSVALLAIHSYISFVQQDRPTGWQLLAISATALLLIGTLSYGYRQEQQHNSVGGKPATYQS